MSVKYVGFIQSNPLLKWSETVKDSNLNIQYNPLLRSEISFKEFIKSFLKHVIYSKLRFGIKRNCDAAVKILIDGRGTIALDDESGVSDLNEIKNTRIPLNAVALRKQILDSEAGLICKKHKMHLIDEFLFKVILFRSKKIASFDHFNLPYDLRSSLLFSKYRWDYIFDYEFYYALYTKYNLKIILSWFRFDHLHFVQKAALNDSGGLFAVKQIAFQGATDIGCMTHADILFGFSKFQSEIEKKQFSKVSNYVIVGYPSNYKNKKVEQQYNYIRNNILSNGACKIIAMFDENSLDDSRWHTGHELQREHYKNCLQEILDNSKIGFIFKPKNPKTLRKRLGSVSILLDEALATGRCFLFDDSSKYVSCVSTLAATMISDLVIHSSAAAGTCAVESALCGKKTILMDLEGWDKTIWYELGDDNVIFHDWDTALLRVREWMNSVNDINFGNCTPLLNEFDPYQDGRCGERIGLYLETLYNYYLKGATSDMALTEANLIYKSKWGVQSIISPVN